MNGFNGFNNYNSAGYMPQNNWGYQQPMQQQPVDTFAWTQGRSGAEAYPLGPGKRAFLMDSNGETLYVKQTDMSGRYMPLQTFRVIPEEDISQAAPPQQLPPAEAIDYDKIREIISEEVSKQYKQRKDGNNK